MEPKPEVEPYAELGLEGSPLFEVFLAICGKSGQEDAVMRQNELFLRGEACDELETASVAQQGNVDKRKDATGKPASGRRGQRSRSLHGQ